MKKYRCWAEVHLDGIARNTERIRRRVGPDVRILVVVKADAYGHGAVPVAKTVLEHGADMLGVGDSTEAIALREAGILAPTLILGAIIEEEIGWVISYDIRPMLHSFAMLRLLSDEARRNRRRVRVHIKVDTGMGRLGVTPDTAIELARRVAESPYLELEGMCTQLSSAVRSPAFTRRQLAQFKSVCDAVEGMGIRIPYRHAANTAALFSQRAAHFNLVRPGAFIYGIDPGNLASRRIVPAPVLHFKSQIAFLKDVPAGTSIGYNRTYVTESRTRLATLPVGYNDGYPFHLSNRGHVLVRGRRAPIRGLVTMDYMMADVGRIPGVRVGDEVTLIGRDGEETIRLEDMAKRIKTVPYDLTCSLGKRVRRVYVDSGPEDTSCAPGGRVTPAGQN
ncbi:MAG: alanine racemase [Planctomycetes bacterium]|nr:alanine racemase [Planctomycetota bacterium]